MRRTTAVLTAVSVVLSGCAVTAQSFGEKRESIGDTRLCRTLASARDGDDHAFYQDVVNEVARRGLTHERCAELVRNQNGAVIAGVIAAVVIGALAASARGGGGGGGASASDYSWAWDLQHGPYGQPVWVCRGIQTGQYADLWRCNGLMKSDYRWPGLGR